MKRICEYCNEKGDCAYLKRKIEYKCPSVQDYEVGYEEAVDKACEWIRNNAVICLMHEEVEDFIEDFKIAMEE